MLVPIHFPEKVPALFGSGNTDDGQPCPVIYRFPEPNVLSDGVLVRKVFVDERLIYDRNRFALLSVPAVEKPSGLDGHTHYTKIAGRDG